MKKTFLTIFISAGEPSGDMHGAELSKNILKINPKTKLLGLGGDKMQKAGVNLLYNMLNIAVVGLWEVSKNLGKFIRIFNDTVEKIKKIKPDLIILIDNPGFNLRLAKRIKHLGIPIVYYVSPQVWAWGSKRIKKMKTLIDKMLVVFKFEEDLYKKNSIDCKFVGHPLIDIVKLSMDKESFKKKFGLNQYLPIIGLLPGSREKEIQNHLPVLIKASKKIKKIHPESIFIIAKSPGINNNSYKKFLKKVNMPVRLIEGYNYDCINVSDFCIVASGTATLETAILETPMIIIYKVSILTWLMLKPQVKLPYIGMPNVISGEKIVPELVQNQFKPTIVANKVCSLLDNQNKLQSLKEKLKNIKILLGEGNASKKAAKEVLRLVGSLKLEAQSI